MLPKFDQFIGERRYLQNLTPATGDWYTQSLKWLPSETPDADALKETAVRMREQGRNACGCNSTIRAINSYLAWSHSAHNSAVRITRASRAGSGRPSRHR